MDTSVRRAIFTVLVLSGFTQLLAQQQAKVIREPAAVYARMSTASKVLTSLRQGDAVSVAFAVSGSGMQWCKVSLLGGQQSGYMLCNQLERRPLPPTPYPGGVEVLTGSPSTAVSDNTASALPAEATDGLANHAYNVGFWSRQLRFTSAQRQHLAALAAETGWANCRQDSAYWLRSQQIYRPGDLNTATPQTKLQAVRRIQACVAPFSQFWERMPEVMTAAQRNTFDQGTRNACPNRVTGVVVNLFSSQ